MHLLWGVASLGGSVYHPVANVLITRLYPDRKGMVLGVTGMGAAVGFAFAPLITGLLTGAFDIHRRTISLLFGFTGAAAGVPAWFCIPGRAAMRRHAEIHPDPLPSVAAGGSRTGAGLFALVIAIACLREIAMWSAPDVSDFFLTAGIGLGALRPLLSGVFFVDTGLPYVLCSFLKGNERCPGTHATMPSSPFSASAVRSA